MAPYLDEQPVTAGGRNLDVYVTDNDLAISQAIDDVREKLIVNTGWTARFRALRI